MKEILAEIETDKATMEFESFDEGTLYTLELEGETAPVDSLLAIIGDEGEVTALIAAKSEPKQSQNRLNPKIKRLQLHQKQQKKKNNIYSACSFTRGSRYCHHATTERHMTEGTVAG
jgi:pyruvate dehydrogenase E2 component (dihydrolipoamide acetyltransferase)